MSLNPHSLQLFGLDLGRAWQQLGPLLRSLHQTPLLSWLTPDVPVRLLRADASAAYWQGSRPLASAPKAVRFEAIEIDPDLLLRKTVQLPALPAAQQQQALALQVQDCNPFAPEDVVWAYHLGADAQAELVIASRPQLQGFIDAQQSRRSHPPLPCEVWALAADGTPIVLPGWDEAQRQRAARRQRHGGYALLALAGALAIAIAITPTAQLRLRAIEAAYAYDAMARETAPLIGAREQYLHNLERLEAVRALLSERAAPILLLETLTQAIADDTYVHHMNANGLKVTLQGMTPNAAKLMQSLGSIPGIKEVKAPTAAVRNPGAVLDNFIIELQLDPAHFSQAVPTTPPTSAPAAPSTTPPTTAPMAPPTGAAPSPSSVPAAPTPAPAPAPAPAPPTQTTSRFSSGG